MKQLLTIVLAALLLAACGETYEEKKRISRQQRLKMMREDSAALKVAVLPTLDCLPLIVAKEQGLFDSLGADVRLKRFMAQMDCDTALVRGRVEGSISDLVRTERIISRGTSLDYVTSTGAYWQLLTNRTARIRDLKQLDDKMVAMTRYSVTDMLVDWAVDSAKLKEERVFKIQVNDVGIRLRMLQNNEMDAVWLTEPQAMEARLSKHRMLADTRRMDWKMGVLAFRKKGMDDKNRQKQLKVLKKGYDMAVDSINRHGVRHYSELVVKYCGVSPEKADSLPRDMKFEHMAAPRQKDIDQARKWLKK
jgi:NitT/TauT family transport system substrate-binding protein